VLAATKVSQRLCKPRPVVTACRSFVSVRSACGICTKAKRVLQFKFIELRRNYLLVFFYADDQANAFQPKRSNNLDGPVERDGVLTTSDSPSALTMLRL
jgi:hypothetical protein